MLKEELLSSIQDNIVEARVSADSEGLFEKKTGVPGVTELVKEALIDGIEAQEIVSKAITAGMTKVGELFKEGSLYLPEMLMAAETVEAAMNILKDHLQKETAEHRGMVVLATVKGDVHDIGKNIVGQVLKGAGYEVRDLGVDVDSQEIVETVRDSGADLLGLSAMLTTTMMNMREVIEKLDEAGIRGQVAVVIGGAPVSQDFADEIGADFYGRDAFEAVDLVGPS